MEKLSELEQHSLVYGVFRPRRLDNLRPEAQDHIGRRIEFTVAWEIESGDYAGQRALMPMERLDPPLGWVPEEDVEFEHEGGAWERGEG